MFARQGSLAFDFGSSDPPARMAADVTDHVYAAISLYSGAGGLDRGFVSGGVDIRWAIDHDPFAVETYNANLPPYGVCGDVLMIDPPSELQPDLVIGGPPCQGFSVIGRMDPSDPRSEHVDHFFDVVARLRPRA
ncbi:MAG: DNA cytosine methyltransferase, partial [Actinomycetota bacterium]|nr:DNA cytosine methyltransferase [Actinomycetota bacterium]